MGYYNQTKWCRYNAHEVRTAEKYELPVAIESYKDAQQWLLGRDSYRGSMDYPAGKREHNLRRMRRTPDGSIAFEYNDHVWCIWHPDNTLTVSPAGGYISGPFTRYVMPRSIEPTYCAHVGKVIQLATVDQDATQTSICMDETVNGRVRCTNPDILVVRAEPSVHLKFDKASERWLPVNEWRCRAFEWFDLDRSQLHEASKKYNISDFVDAIETALMLGAPIPTAGSNRRSLVDVTTMGGESILQLLEQQRFAEAAALVRVNETRTWDPVNRTYSTESKKLKSVDVKRIRGMAYKEAGLLYIESERIVALPQLYALQNKIKEYGSPANL